MITFRSNRDVAIEVADLAGAEEFYGGALGFRLERKAPGLLVYDTGHITLYVKQADEPVPSVLSFSVPSLEEAKAHLIENGAEILVEWGRSLYFQDPLGIVHDVIEDGE